jgi:hypothetical protein
MHSEAQTPKGPTANADTGKSATAAGRKAKEEAAKKAAKEQADELRREKEREARARVEYEQFLKELEFAKAMMQVLRTSWQREEREKAFAALAEMKELPGEYAPEFARFIALGGWEADAAIRPLALTLGTAPASAAIAELSRERSLDTLLRVNYACLEVRQSRSGNIPGERRPEGATLTLKDRDAEARFAVLMTMRRWPLIGPMSLLPELLADQSEFVRVGAAVMTTRVPAELRDGMHVYNGFPLQEWEKALRVADSAIIRYVAAVEKERAIRAEHPTGWYEPLPKAKEEAAQREAALRKAALPALQECLRLAKEADADYERLAVFECLDYIYPAVEADHESVVKAIRGLKVQEGSLLEKEIQGWLRRHWKVRGDRSPMEGK